MKFIKFSFRFVYAFVKYFIFLNSIIILMNVIIHTIKIIFYNSTISVLLSDLLGSTEDFVFVALFLSLLNAYKYMELQKKFLLTGSDKENIKTQIKQMVVESNSKIVADDNEKIIFRIPFWDSLWKEVIQIKINDDELIIYGPNYFIKAVIDELIVLKIIDKEINCNSSE